jgi:hypothetical protein
MTAPEPPFPPINQELDLRRMIRARILLLLDSLVAVAINVCDWLRSSLERAICCSVFEQTLWTLSLDGLLLERIQGDFS